MKKTLVWIILTVFAVSLTLMGTGCQQEAAPAEEMAAEEEPAEEMAEEVQEEAAPEEEEMAEETEEAEPLTDIHIGNVMPYLEGWFTYFDQGFNIGLQQEDVEVTQILTNWEPEAEIQAVRDMIALGVDAISVTSGNPDAAQTLCQIANDAGVPIQIVDTRQSEGPGEPFEIVEFDWYEVGVMFGEKIAENWPDSKVVQVQGLAGFSTVESQIEAMEKIEEDTGAYETVQLEYTDYGIETAKNIIRDLIQSGREFDVVVCGAQEMAEGTIQALEEANMLEEVIVISGNGGVLDEANFAAGKLDAAISQPCGLHGIISAISILEYLKGNPPLELVQTPIVWSTVDNWEETLIPWDIDESWIPVAEEFIKTGELVY